MDEIDSLLQEILDNAPNILPVTAIPDLDLIKFYDEVKEDLLERGEAIQQTTQEGRDLHSWRVALLVEIRRRNLR